MVFSTTNLFKGISCPYGEQCSLTNCIFSHDLRPKEVETSETSIAQPIRTRNSQSEEPATKRRKVTYDKHSDKPPSKAEQIRAELQVARRASTVTTQQKHSPTENNLTENGNHSQPRSLTRPISPPPTNGKAAPQQTNITRPDNSKHDNKNDSFVKAPTKLGSEPSEKLNPRLISNDPAGHNKRTLYLKHLHDAMALLNERVKNSTLEHKHLLVLTERELVKMALDEEEKVARDQPTVYANIIKNRIAAYKKMKVLEWTAQVKTTFEKEKVTPPPTTTTTADAKPIQTDLTPNEELLLLPHLVADQSRLSPFGYIPTPPTAAAAAEAAAAVEASHNYEICDRCSSRFQVFPDRNEEGLLASNGPCKHHPNRKVFPQKTKGDAAMGHLKEAYYPCCNAVVGSPGCTENEYHVFKASAPARLAAVLPFITTPENENPAKDRDGETVSAVCFDCEMGYTVYGLELIRLTAVAWPSGKELVDVLVRPLGTVIDLNSRFSGVWPEAFSNAVPFEEWQSTSSSSQPSNTTKDKPLPIVPTPQAARALLTSYLTPTTPLLGHAIDNDLNAIRLCHPTIIDSVLLYPHPRGLPMRFGLKMLAAKYLGRSIQMGGERGHDSLEDAVATGELVRVKVGEKWRVLRAQGWRLGMGGLVAPAGGHNAAGSGGLTESEREGRAKAMVDKAFDGGAAGKKRRKRFPGLDGKEDESTEDEEIGVGVEVSS